MVLSPWLLLGHGLPKLCHWLFGIETWGPHAQYLPKNFSSGLVAIIEFAGPLMILLGFKVRIVAALVALTLVISSLAGPLPWHFERIPVEGAVIPFAIIPSKELTIRLAIAYFALVLFGKDEVLWQKVWGYSRSTKNVT
jgi:uncharacterized membrane protein YphA (DoxX/SURF4 family)